MMRQFRVVAVVAICCVTGCWESESTVETNEPARIDTCEGMIEYLDRQNLPALKSVERWDNSFGPGLKLTTRHYEVFTTLLEPLMLSQIPGFVESAYRSYNSQLPEAIETKGKFTVYLFAGRDQWLDFTNEFAGRQASLYGKIKAGAYYLNGVCVAYDIGRERTFSVLGHEGWHQFNSRHFRYRLPSWLDEGIAMLFETSRYERGMFRFEPERNLNRLGALKATLVKDKMLGLEELMSLNPGEVLGANGSDAIVAFYAQSYALVRFLREDNYGRRLRNYHELLVGGLKGEWPLGDAAKIIASDRNIPLTIGWNRRIGPQLFMYYVDEDLRQIEDEYMRFCRKIVYHVHFK